MFPDLTRDDVFRIETRSLWLRWPRAKDVGAIVRLAGERSVAEMTARIRHPIDRAETEAFVLGARRGNAAGGGLAMALSLRSEPDGLIGMVGIESVADDDRPHFGYWLGRPYWGRGLATQAAEAMVHAYFAYAGGTVLGSDARVENPASRRVLEKSGFVRTGTGTEYCPVRARDLTCDRFRLDRAAWSARSATVDCDRAA